MKACIAFINEKGGTSKTTLAVHAASYLASAGMKTVLLDMDPQGSAGKCLGVDLGNNEPSIFELLISEKISVQEVLKSTSIDNLSLIPSDKRLSDLTLNIVQHPRRYAKLAKSIRHLADYKFVLIDSPPSLGLPAINILMAADEVVIPVPMNFLGVNGCIQVLQTIFRLQREFSQNRLTIRAFVPVMYRESKRQEVLLGHLRKHLGKRVTQSVIPFDENVDLAQGLGKTLFEIAPDSPAACAMTALFQEIFPNIEADSPAE